MLCLKSIKEHKCYPCTLMKFNQLLIFILVISFEKRFEIGLGAKWGRIIRTVQMQLETVGIARTISVRKWFLEFQKRPEFLHAMPKTQQGYVHGCRRFYLYGMLKAM